MNVTRYLALFLVVSLLSGAFLLDAHNHLVKNKRITLIAKTLAAHNHVKEHTQHVSKAAATRDVSQGDSTIILSQYGKNNDIPGIISLKSRGLNSGDLAPVKVGDTLYQETISGVTDINTVPTAASVSITVPTGGVPTGQGYVATEFSVGLTSLDGPAKGMRPVFKISSEGVLQLLETTSTGSHTTVPSGIVTLNSSGIGTVTNVKIPANARILLTAQPTKAPKGAMFVSAITPNTSFTIKSTSGATDAGVNVFYMILVPLP